MRIFNAMTCSALATATLSAALIIAPGASATPEDTDNLHLRDQHNMPVVVPESARYVLFVGDTAGKDLISSTFGQADSNILEENSAYVIANFSEEPTALLQRYTVPELQDLPYQVLMDTTGAQTGDWDHAPGAVKLLRLDAHQVTAVEVVDSPAALMQAVTEATAAGTDGE